MKKKPGQRSLPISTNTSEQSEQDSWENGEMFDFRNNPDESACFEKNKVCITSGFWFV